MISQIVLGSLLSLLAIGGLGIIPTQEASINLGPSLLMTKLGTQATSLGVGCYYPILVRMNMTWTQPSTIYPISMGNFWLVITSRNIVVSNSTRLSYQTPTNTIDSFNLFPNLPVTLVLSFQKTCVSNVNIVQLLYLDGTYNFTFPLP